jgi:hypothetical protein
VTFLTSAGKFPSSWPDQKTLILNGP